jgi:cellulose biosynthesis protein BcsQ
MKVMVIDNSSENQVKCARRLEAISERDKELLDLQIKVVTEKEYEERIDQADVLILGSGLGNSAITITRRARAKFPWINVIMYFTEQAYADGAFRSVHAEGVRKALADNSSPIDLLQELIAIHADFKRDGRARDGRVIVVCHAKGGVGATSIVAGLAEVFSSFNRRTLLWDLDTASRDLSRSLAVTGAESRIISEWVNGGREINRDSVREAVIPISDGASVLIPPDGIAESIDLVCHTDGMLIAERIVEVTSNLFDTIIVDTAGHLGPAMGALLRAADQVVVVIDDGALGLTAVDLFLDFVKALVGSSDKITLLVNSYTGNHSKVSQLASQLEPSHQLGGSAWRLPPVPYEPKAALWPATGRTLYSLGTPALRNALVEIAVELGVVNKNQITAGPALDSIPSGKWYQRFLGRKGGGMAI